MLPLAAPAAPGTAARVVARLSTLPTLVVSASSAALLMLLFAFVPRVIDLELAFTRGEFVRAWHAWAFAFEQTPLAARITALNAFRVATALDFLYIPSYSVLLAALYLRAAGLHRNARPVARLDVVLLVTCAAAAALDVLENVGLFAAAGAQPPSAIAVLFLSIASALKWSAIALAVVLVVREFASAPRRRVLWLSRYTLISMALGTIPLIATSQGRDLLQTFAETKAWEQRFFFYVTLALWGLSVWYWTRVVLDANMRGIYAGTARYLPRVLGALTMVLPGVPIVIHQYNTAAGWWLFAWCVALAGVFLLYTWKRRKNSPPGALAAAGFTVAGVRNTPASRFATGSLVASLVVFYLFVAHPIAVGRHLGAVAIVFIAAANTVFFGSLAVFISESVNVRVDVIAFACAAAFSFWNDNHDVPSRPLSPLPRLTASYDSWYSGIARESPVVFVVAAEGGGVRAAYWTATVLGSLGDGVSRFPNHLFAVSGVSGGTLGAAVYARLRQHYPHDTAVTARAQSVLERDLLSPTLAKLVSGDFLQWFVPLPVPAFDRSRAMEDGFRDAYARTTGGRSLDGDITELAPDSALGVPAVLMNTTIVDAGRTAIVAPFTWTADELPRAVQYACWVGDCEASLVTPRLAAPTIVRSIHNSARFTYVSPAGRVRTPDGAAKGHVVDGGYFDPTGVETLIDLVRVLAQPGRPHAEIVPIYVTNAAVASDVNARALAASQRPNGSRGVVDVPTLSEDATASTPLEVLGELFAPVRALFGTRIAHGELAISRLRSDSKVITFGFCDLVHEDDVWRDVRPDEPHKKLPDPPLGWELSPSMTGTMRTFWQYCPANDAGRRAVENWLKP